MTGEVLSDCRLDAELSFVSAAAACVRTVSDGGNVTLVVSCVPCGVDSTLVTTTMAEGPRSWLGVAT